MSNILTNNINPRSGNLITIGGANDRVSIAGTLTYEDVSNIDSVGIITAQSGLQVTGGQLLVGTTSGDGIIRVFGSSGRLIVGDSSINYYDSNTHIFRNYAATERMRIDSSGRLSVGFAGLDIVGANIQESGASGCSLLLHRNATTVINDDSLGLIRFYSNAGSSNQEHARISGLCDGTAGADDKPGRLVFYTTADGASSPTERLRITSAGKVGINETSPSAILSVKGTVTAGAGSNEDLQQWNIGSDNVKAEIKYIDAAASRGMLFGTTTDHNLAFQTNNTERMRLDNSGRLLIGTSTDVGDQLLQVIGGSSAAADFFLGNSVASTGQTAAITFGPANSIAGSQIICTAEEDFSTGANRTARLEFSTRFNGTLAERMRITPEGRVALGQDGAGAAERLQVRTSNDIQNQGYGIYVNTSTVNNANLMRFGNGNGVVGSITSSGSATSYNESSDYRLKENVVDIVDGITRLKQLQPRRFNFIADAETTVDGFIAHEAQVVVPQSVTGTKDEVDDDGNPVMQGIDKSKLVPLLTAALQEAITKIETLEQRLTDAGL